MKQLRLEDVHFEMLKEVAKRKRMKPEEFVEVIIQEYFNDPKKKMILHLTPYKMRH